MIKKSLQLPVLGLVVLIILAIIGPMIIPFDPSTYNLSQQMQLPSLHHWMGTDENGRDIFVRVLYGTRVSLGIGVCVTFLCAVLGVFAGFLAGFKGGWFERLFLMVSDIFQAFPGILLAIAVAAFLPPTVLNVIVLLSFVGWVGYARVTRAQVMSVREKEYIQATEALGVPLHLVFFKHVLPNIAGPLMVQAAFGMAGIILVESTLSFLGLGLPVTIPSWGRMLDTGSSLLLIAPHLSIFPGLAIMCSVLIFNLLGDRLRDLLSRQ